MTIGGGLPELSVRRPLLAMVISLMIVLTGLAALFGVEVRELPDVDRPVVTVRAALPGAAPETMDAEVTSVLESAVARVSGVREIFASSEENSARLRAEFQPGVNLDTAASDVREAVNRVSRQLPDRVENLFVTKADDDAQPIAQVSIVTDNYSEEEITRIIQTTIAPAFLSIDGVAALQEFGTRQRQMRVTIDPLRLSRFGLTVGDVANALRQSPFDVPVGSFRSDQQQLLVRAEATASTPDLIKDVLIQGDVRVGDVAEVVLAPADATNLLRLNGEPVIGLGIVRRAQSNTIAISDLVRDKVDELNDRFDDLELQIISDNAVFIRTAVSEVLITLAVTVLIVIATIWLFLGSFKATLIPAVAIPVSIIGTLAGLWLAGFTINLLTLLALILATGLIVDDAIVVLENIQRKQSDGLKKSAAAAIGTRQVYFAVIATTAVLIAVFVPISFLPSTVGRLFREFGFVMALSVGISSIVALSLVPAMASKMQFASSKRQSSVLTKIGNAMLGFYRQVLAMCFARPISTLAVSIVAAGGAAFAFNQLDSELVPREDRGQVSVFASGPDGVGLAFMERQADQIEEILQPYLDSGEFESVFTIVGRWDPNRIFVTAELAPWDERARSQDEIIAELRRPLSEIPGVRASAFARGSLSRGRGQRSGLEVALLGSDYDAIYQSARALSDAIETQSDILTNPDISYAPTQPQLSIQIDRRRAADLEVPLDEVSLTLRAMVGGENVVDINVGDEAIPVVLEAQASTVTSPADLRNLLVRSSAGDLLPLSSLTDLVEEGVAAELERLEQRRAIEMEMDIASGVPLAEAVAEIRAIAADVLPRDTTLLLGGSAETLQESSRDLLLTYAFALIIVFLVLIAQFESVSSPLVILLIVPFGLAAAIYALF
ncbi:MAG: efflux RND transporter permease subunit, partial [Pseudomonadota bacterium]